jgi:3-phosphoshikimate 1-carboxyvinyltransferase
MPDLIIRPSGPLRGETTVPGDKSITHRAIILGALADGDTVVRGWVPAEVCLATLSCVQALGVEVEETLLPSQPPGRDDSWFWGEADAREIGDQEGAAMLIHGAGLGGLREPADVLHCAGSGTTIRLLAGLLAGQPFCSVLTGTEPLRRRPMGRIAEPLRLMGATILGRDDGRLAPLTIRGGNLRGIEYAVPVASAQVKSAILLAGLFAGGETVIHEPGPSRDHTERMLRDFEVKVETEVKAEGRRAAVRVIGGQKLSGGKTLDIPGDFSSAAFPLVAATIVAGSDVQLSGVGVNPTRTGLYDLLVAMGAELHVADGRQRTKDKNGVAPKAPSSHRDASRSLVLRPPSDAGEPISTICVRSSQLRATEAAGDLIVRAIDEFPIFAVAATQAEGMTVVREAQELRVKESDRIATVATELRKMGADIEERPDGMVVRGPTRLHGAIVECHRDHRLAMALAVAGLVARGETVVHGAEAIDDSFPGFVETMQALGADIGWGVEG